MLFNKLTLLLIAGILSQNSNEDFFQLKLSNLDNKTISFTEFKKNKATVIIFLLSDCPASQSYTLTLNKLAKQYLKDNIAFVGVFPGNYSTDDELKNFNREYKVAYPLLKDPEMILVKKLNAKVAPSCYVIDANGKTVYKGRIDDWLYAFGKKKQVITANDLSDAINAVIKNQPVKVAETKPIGCILEFD